VTKGRYIDAREDDRCVIQKKSAPESRFGAFSGGRSRSNTMPKQRGKRAEKKKSSRNVQKRKKFVSKLGGGGGTQKTEGVWPKDVGRWKNTHQKFKIGEQPEKTRQRENRRGLCGKKGESRGWGMGGAVDWLH